MPRTTPAGAVGTRYGARDELGPWVDCAAAFAAKAAAPNRRVGNARIGAQHGRAARTDSFMRGGRTAALPGVSGKVSLLHPIYAAGCGGGSRHLARSPQAAHQSRTRTTSPERSITARAC